MLGLHSSCGTAAVCTNARPSEEPSDSSKQLGIPDVVLCKQADQLANPSASTASLFLSVQGHTVKLWAADTLLKSIQGLTKSTLYCEPSSMRYLRYEEVCFSPEKISSISSLKSTYFPLSIVYCFYSKYFIIGVIVKFLLQQRLQLSSTCRRVAMWTSRTEAVVYVVRRRSLWFSDDSE